MKSTKPPEGGQPVNGSRNNEKRNWIVLIVVATVAFLLWGPLLISVGNGETRITTQQVFGIIAGTIGAVLALVLMLLLAKYSAKQASKV